MIIDNFGQHIFNEKDICNLYMIDPNRQLKLLLVKEVMTFDPELDLQKLPELLEYQISDQTIEEFDDKRSNEWFIPDEYKNFDIAKWVLEQCKTDEELQRAGEELIMFQERGMFILLQYLKYLVDTMRKNNIVWGVGRGSSIASFVLYLIGIHRIHSLYYQISINEFLK
jgi:DNA polymerase III alpha subunit